MDSRGRIAVGGARQSHCKGLAENTRTKAPNPDTLQDSKHLGFSGRDDQQQWLGGVGPTTSSRGLAGADVVVGCREITVQDIRNACVSSKTYRAYKGSLASISKWIRASKGESGSQYFTADGEIDVGVFTARDFESFLLEKRKTVSVATLSGYRSAIKDLYRRREVPLPIEKSMATFFSGLKRMEATRLQSGSPKESGKDPLPFSLYRELCKATITRDDGGFAHMFLTTQWNLMCRSESVQRLCTEHLSWHDDSIGCIMHKSKTNQEGTGPKDPRHMYGNVFSPDTCWITALALYLACRPTQAPGPLFPGSEQKARFGSALRKLIADQKHRNHYETHSIRNGVATFACSGCTGGPSIASVCLRVGWSLGGVQDRYIRYETAGDQFLGRVVAGLPLNRPQFASLPPHFKDNDDPAVGACVQAMYPELQKVSGLRDILKLCVASLVKHSSYFRAELPSTPPPPPIDNTSISEQGNDGQSLSQYGHL
ncbi:hypothetical protein PPTG_01900 [Phytophthora nicotianae INRA-310]|uniref:Core-binding (CB) domain-containing protein n=1 Tax=Phytophthora nicotianae (strain INRA-310) TaxID=761204 RepID=W2R8T9_PHYN3|nr:hypothetical protein PPTG_01900 [Phytophthora nicotianae INRA-310]ETN21808.1 hypothetical protein PPTG_01900 [Phytophthora nicotianae INRA-310]